MLIFVYCSIATWLKFARSKVYRKGVLFPEILQLPASEATVLEGVMDELVAVGFDLSNLGGGSYAINGIPSGVEGLNPVELVAQHAAYSHGKR